MSFIRVQYLFVAPFHSLEVKFTHNEMHKSWGYHLMGSNKCSLPKSKPQSWYGILPSPQKIPSWRIPVNPWPACKMQLLFSFSWPYISLSPIQNWPKVIQNLCHITKDLVSRWLSYNNEESKGFIPKSMHFSLLFAPWFLRNVASIKWQDTFGTIDPRIILHQQWKFSPQDGSSSPSCCSTPAAGTHQLRDYQACTPYSQSTLLLGARDQQWRIAPVFRDGISKQVN